MLTAATSGPAQLLALPDIGGLAAGMRADFVVLDGELAKPDLRYEGVRTVVKGGVIYVDSGRWIGPPSLSVP